MKYLKIPIEKFEKKIGYSFKNKELIKDAITHPSYISKQIVASFERLEFLGDKILGMAIAEKLLIHFPNEDEGKIAIRYSNLTNKESLYNNLKNINIIDDIELMDDCKTPAVYADIMEAIIGAIFCDSNYNTIRNLIFQWFDINDSHAKNPKNILQEYLQSLGMQFPCYLLTKTNKNYFEITVSSEELQISATGIGQNKKTAEQNAAKKLLKIIDSKQQPL